MTLSSALRRLSTFLVLVSMTAGLTVASRVDAAGASLRPPDVPGTGVYFGASASTRSGETKEDAILRTESQIGRTLALDHQFYRWDETLPTPHQSFDVAGGRIPFVSWKPMRRDRSVVSWTRIAGGAEDAWITAQADRIRDFGHPLFMVFNHEPYDQSTSGWGTPDEFVASWRRIVDIFRDRGAVNVGWVLVLTAWDYRVDGRAEAFYPGDGYVDWLAADPYNFFERDGQWRELSFVTEGFYQWGSARNKPLMLGEWGSNEDPAIPGRKAEWFNNAAAWLKTRPNIKALAYYNNHQIYDWSIDSSPSSLAAFTAMASDPWFGATAAAPNPDPEPEPTPEPEPEPTPVPGDLADWDMDARLEDAGGRTFNAKSLTGTAGWSGLTASRTHPGVYWMHLDHPFNSGPGRIHAVRLNRGVVEEIRPGELIQTVQISGARQDQLKNDWEDITVDGSGNIWVFAHNADALFSAPEVDPASSSSTTLDRTIAAPNSSNSETIFWFDGSLYWVNKVDPGTTRTRMWKKAMPSGDWKEVGPIAEPPGGFGSKNRICGGDVSDDGRRVALVNKEAVYIYEGSSPEDAVSRAPRWTLRHTEGSLTESLAFAPGTYDLYLGGEEGWLKFLPADAYGPGSPEPTPTTTTSTTTTSTTTTSTTTTSTTTTTTTLPPTTTTTTEPTPEPGPSGPVAFGAAADARVVKGDPHKNFGKSSVLIADGSPDTETYLRFDVAGLNAPVKSARLRLYVENKSSNGPEVYAAPGDWSETEITWSNRPDRIGPKLDDVRSVRAGRYAEWDVTAYVRGNGAYSFALVADSRDGTDFKSKENGSNLPELVIELA